jgi:type 1 glutamine amidotransferase
MFRKMKTHSPFPIRFAVGIGVLLSVASALGWCAEPEPRQLSEVEQVIAAAEAAKSDNAALKKLKIVLLADQKDHGVGEHDYPRWQARWSFLLGGIASSSEAAAAVNGVDLRDESVTAGAPGVQIERAWQWPETAQWDSADLVVAFCYLKWTPDRFEQVRRFLTRGGGLVLIHSATWTMPSPSAEVAGLVGVGGFQRWRHGSVEMEIAKPEHPICRGLPRNLKFEDETYWLPAPALDNARIEVLATCRETTDLGQLSPPQPLYWTYRVGSGRVFGCVPGHNNWTIDDPYFRLLLLRGMAWAAGESPYRFDGLALKSARVADAPRK